MLPLLYDRSRRFQNLEERAEEVLSRVGLAHKKQYFPNQISGGEQQRVAIARALINEPALILADEPTGNLDSHASTEIMAVFQRLNDSGVTIVMVTHEPDIARYAKRVIVMRDGRLTNVEEITTIMRASHRLSEGADDDFEIHTQSEIIERASATSRTMTLLLGAIACVSLIVGGIGIMNIMLVSVTERTREIGIRLAVGARSGAIMAQFLIESVLLSLSGGFIGVVVAILMAALLNTTFRVTTVIQPLIALVAFAFAGTVGIFFGFYPARKAANLNPIDALRYE